jgi:DNA-binding NtrC family response regulator
VLRNVRGGPERRLIHPALAAVVGDALGEASLTDRQRVGVLLQASSLLAHLERAGLRLENGWAEARIDDSGLLRGVRAVPGDDSVFPQMLLKELSTYLFRINREVAGRGEARRVVRRLLETWDQNLTSLAPDRAVQQILDEARFLWGPSFSHVRRTLAGEHGRKGGPRLWVAGPRKFRESLLAATSSREELERQLASDRAVELWVGRTEPGEPVEHLEAGRWRSAVEIWRLRSNDDPAERLAFARALYGLGRFEEALGELARLRAGEARILLAWCLYRLGRLAASRREVGKLARMSLSEEEVVDAAAVAIRLYGNLGEREKARSWVGRALQSTEGRARLRAELLAFAEAWDRKDGPEMRRRLAAAQPLREEVGLAWRWHKAKGLEAVSRGDGADAVAHLSQALALARRGLSPLEAASLWNELALGRSLADDLAGAERALLHTLRLLADAEGPRKTTLILFNLAEVRLRRGRLQGVRGILEQSARENRHSRNWRGLVHDTELWARLELVRGRPSAALNRLRVAIEEFDRRGIEWRRGQLRALLARALGWLGESEEASRELEAAGAEAVSEFEPEERPAVWALAGDRQRALTVLGEGAPARIWEALLRGGGPRPELWDELDRLEDYRFARLVFDFELFSPGIAPRGHLRRAAMILRRVGAGPLAARLERDSARSWRAVERFFERGAEDRRGLRRLFVEAGYAESRLSFRRGDQLDVIAPGAGGPAALSKSLPGGELHLEAPWIDPALSALFQVAVNVVEVDPSSCYEREDIRPQIVGEAEALKKAMQRVARLAPADVPVLILGETGTGKELFARRVHGLSSRSRRRFVAINCAAVAEELLMSDLFGHVRGAYTGAIRDRVGVFESARGGTVFLDEIGDLPLRAQGFLLRVLQEGEIRRVGESLPRPVDVRVVVATHRDLEQMVAEGTFRADLFYRLKVASVELPPLRERDRDVLLLAEHFLRQLRPEVVPRISSAARRALLNYRWPGNVRELQNVLSVAVAMAQGSMLRPRDLDLPGRLAVPEIGYHERVLNFRRRLVEEALSGSGGNRAEAARRLGVTRQALSYLVRKLEISL